MKAVNISIDASDRRVFEEEYWAWVKSLPQPPGAVGHLGTMPAMHGPTPQWRCNYMSVPEPFLEVLKAKGVSFRTVT
jgi:hypothetical protein